MTARELIELLSKAPEAEVRVAVVEEIPMQDDHPYREVTLVVITPGAVTLNPEANAWIIEP